MKEIWRKTIVWFVEICVGVFQIITVTSNSPAPTGILNTLLTLALLFSAPAIAALVLLLLFKALKTGDQTNVRTHMGISIIVLTVLIFIVSVVYAFSSGFGLGIASIIIFGIFGFGGVFLGMLFFATRKYNGGLISSWGGSTHDTETEPIEKPMAEEEEKKQEEVSRCRIYRGFGMSRSEVGAIYPDGRVTNSVGVFDNFIGRVDIDGTVYSYSGAVGFVNSSGSVYRGTMSMFNECIGEVSYYGTIYKGTGMSSHTVGETDSGPLSRRGGAAYLLLFDI